MRLVLKSYRNRLLTLEIGCGNFDAEHICEQQISFWVIISILTLIEVIKNSEN